MKNYFNKIKETGKWILLKKIYTNNPKIYNLYEQPNFITSINQKSQIKKSTASDNFQKWLSSFTGVDGHLNLLSIARKQHLWATQRVFAPNR